MDADTHPRPWTALLSVAVVAAVIAAGLAFVLHRSVPQTRSTSPGAAAITDRTRPIITGRTWELTAVTQQDGAGEVGNLNVDLRLGDDGTFSTSDGCNSVSGRVRVDHRTLRFSQIVMSAVGCPPYSVISTIDRIFQTSASWSIGHDTLTLSRRGTGSLRYDVVPLPSRIAPGLAGVTWRLLSVRPHGRTLTDSGAGQSTLMLSDHGFASDHRCYSNTGNARLTKRTIVLGASTPGYAIPCPMIPGRRGVLQQDVEQDEDDLLVGTLSWSIAGRQLTLTKPGIGQLTFVRVDSNRGRAPAEHPSPSASPTIAMCAKGTQNHNFAQLKSAGCPTRG